MRRLKENLIVDLYEYIIILKEFLESLGDSRNFYDHQIRELAIGWINCILNNENRDNLINMFLSDCVIKKTYDTTQIDDRFIYLIGSLGIWSDKHVCITEGVDSHSVFVKIYHTDLTIEDIIKNQILMSQENWDYLPERYRNLS